MAREPYDNENTGSDYQFSADQESSPADYQYEEAPIEQPKQKTARKPLDKKKLIIIAAVVLVLVIIFIVYSLMGGKKSQSVTTASTTPAVTAPVTTTTSTPQIEQQEQAIQQVKVPTLSSTEKSDLAAVPDLEKAVEQMKTVSTNLAQSVSQAQFQNQTDITNLESSVSKLSDSLKQVTATVTTLSNAVYQQQQAQRQAAYARQQASEKAAAAIRQRRDYFVDAVIPGRAWLKGIDGSTITVAVGNKLPGYGTVLSINPYSGVVKTSAGDIPYAASAQ
jgi:intracellular multiplication protein IcmG